jgi:hypothetical protein
MAGVCDRGWTRGRRTLDYNQRIRDWLRKQLQEYQLTPELLVERLEHRLSVPTMTRLLNGHIQWSTISKDLKSEIVPHLETALGPLPDIEDQSALREVDFRQAAGTELLEDIQQDIQALLSEEADQVNSRVPDEKETSDFINATDGIEVVCGCGTPIWISHEGRCPNCKKRADASQ